jgi:hypothetical protein
MIEIGKIVTLREAIFSELGAAAPPPRKPAWTGG